jgi:hypothetical protein
VKEMGVRDEREKFLSELGLRPRLPGSLPGLGVEPLPGSLQDDPLLEDMPIVIPATQKQLLAFHMENLGSHPERYSNEGLTIWPELVEPLKTQLKEVGLLGDEQLEILSRPSKLPIMTENSSNF